MLFQQANQTSRFWPSLPPQAKQSPRGNKCFLKKKKNISVAGCSEQERFKKLTNNLIIDDPLLQALISFPPLLR